MKTRIFTAAALAAALLATQTGRASAQIGEAIAGGIIGGIIGSALQQNARPRATTRTVVVDSGLRQQAREVQVALNHFGWNVGAPDGVLGRQSRAGISQFQQYLGFAVTGQLLDFERLVLVTGYQRALAGGPEVTRVSQGHRDGIRGILEAVRDEMRGPAHSTATGPQPMPPNPGATAAEGAMPNFLTGGARPQTASLASHCNRVALVTSANGGYSDLGSMNDPLFTLNEQFCLARGYAIADGEALMAQLGIAPDAVAAQCDGLGSALQAQVSALSLQPRAAVLAGMTQWMPGSGMNPADLATNARICLASGYATDNLPVAMGSALILTALGETAYGELPAHHLMQGIGAAQRRDLAAEWFEASVPVALSAAVSFQPGPAARNALLLAALHAANGTAPASVTGPAAPAPVPVPYPAATK